MGEKSKYSVLIVDDEPDILDFLAYNLRSAGFMVYVAEDGPQGLALALQHKPDIILLDVMMPGMDGMEVCAEIRQHADMEGVVIAFLSARGEDYSQIAGFHAGADDYITKPIRPKVLVSRIQALLRRSRRKPIAETLPAESLGGLQIDQEAFLVRKQGVEVSLTRKEFQLLVMLVSHPNVVLRREQIFTSIWGGQSQASDRTIDVHIRKIREKTGADNIKTIKGVGYKWVV